MASKLHQVKCQLFHRSEYQKLKFDDIKIWQTNGKMAIWRHYWLTYTNGTVICKASLSLQSMLIL